MARYTEDFLATARHGYENTDQPMRELARELGIGITTLSTLAENHGWAKRSLRKRSLPPAMQLLAEAQALATSGPHPSRLAAARLAPQDDGVEAATPTPTLPLAGRGSAPAHVEGSEQTAPIATESPALLDRMEQILAQLIAEAEAAPANGIRSPHGARNLATLIQVMRTLKGMRGPASADTGTINNDYDDMPRDLDEFRHALARRIRAFVESRTRTGNADGNSGCADVAAAE